MTHAPRPADVADTANGLDGITADEFRASMRHYPAGVTIVTLTADGRPVGFTATSFASLSADPPLVSFNIAHTSSSMEALSAAGSVVIHLLGDHQHQLAQRFSRSADQRFADPTLWETLDTGEPVLHGTPIRLRVSVTERIALGDHTLIVGLVTRVDDATGGSPATPLLYYQGGYHRPATLEHRQGDHP